MTLGFLGLALATCVWDRAGMEVRPPTHLLRSCPGVSLANLSTKIAAGKLQLAPDSAHRAPGCRVGGGLRSQKALCLHQAHSFPEHSLSPQPAQAAPEGRMRQTRYSQSRGHGGT